MKTKTDAIPLTVIRWELIVENSWGRNISFRQWIFTSSHLWLFLQFGIFWTVLVRMFPQLNRLKVLRVSRKKRESRKLWEKVRKDKKFWISLQSSFTFQGPEGEGHCVLIPPTYHRKIAWVDIKQHSRRSFPSAAMKIRKNHLSLAN